MANIDGLTNIAGKNLLIGGDFLTNPWQRGNVSIGAGASYGPDRWKFAGAGFADANIDISRAGASTWINSEAGYVDLCRIQRQNGTTSPATVHMAQVLEPKFFQQAVRVGQRVTFSCYVRAPVGSTIGETIGIKLSTTTSETDDGYSAWSDEIQGTNNFIMGSTWTRYSVTLEVDSAARNIKAELIFNFIGTAGVQDLIDIANCQLELGPEATAFEYRHPAIELALCQRYYQKLGTGLQGKVLNTLAVEFSTIFPVPMRTIPTVALESTSFAFNEIGVAVRDATGGAIYGSGLTKTGVQYVGVSAATIVNTPGTGNMISGNTEHILIFDAEI